jgi:hypothetical protein
MENTKRNKEDYQTWVAGRMSIINALVEELKTNDADSITISRWRLKEMCIAECHAMMEDPPEVWG